MNKSRNKKRGLWIALGVFVVLCALMVGAAAWYVSDPYEPQIGAYMALTEPCETVQIETEEEVITFIPDTITCGLIFYPGGLVEYEAYAPLLKELAKEGCLCVLLKMPWDLAVMDMNAADGIMEKYPEVTTWYIGGHSLGGVMAARYALNHAEAFEGVVLLGSYLDKDLSQTDLKVLSVYGSEDGVMRRDKYADSVKWWPVEYEEHVIEGGCHAFFGDYGPQKGDGEATITREEQIRRTAEFFAAWIKNE